MTSILLLRLVCGWLTGLLREQWGSQRGKLKNSSFIDTLHIYSFCGWKPRQLAAVPSRLRRNHPQQNVRPQSQSWACSVRGAAQRADLHETPGQSHHSHQYESLNWKKKKNFMLKSKEENPKSSVEPELDNVHVATWAAPVNSSWQPKVSAVREVEAQTAV